MSGFDGPGVMAGLHYQPSAQLKLGLSYRSRMKLDMDGTTVLPDAGGVRSDSSSAFSIADEVRAGGAYSVMGNKLLVVGELFMRFHDAVNNQIVTKTAGQADGIIPLKWRNSFGGRGGVEFLAHPKVPLRAGFAAVQSATPKGNRGELFSTTRYFGGGIARCRV